MNNFNFYIKIGSHVGKHLYKLKVIPHLINIDDRFIILIKGHKFSTQPIISLLMSFRMRADESWQHQSDDCLQKCQSDMSCSLWMVVHSSHLSQCPSPIQAWRSPLCPEAWPLCPSPGPPGWDSPPSLLESVSCWSVTSTPRWVLHSASVPVIIIIIILKHIDQSLVTGSSCRTCF